MEVKTNSAIRTEKYFDLLKENFGFKIFNLSDEESEVIDVFINKLINKNYKKECSGLTLNDISNYLEYSDDKLEEILLNLKNDFIYFEDNYLNLKGIYYLNWHYKV